MAGDDAGRGEAAELQSLAAELSRRDIKTILAPDKDDSWCLEVINLRPAQGIRITGTIWYRNGSFWWAGLEEVPGAGDLTRAIDFVCTVLRWSTQALGGTHPAAGPAG